MAAICILFSCNLGIRDKPIKSKQVLITYLPELSWIDSAGVNTGIRISKVDYFLVKCDGFDSTEINAEIARYAKALHIERPCPYPQCNMLFFRETEVTNPKNLAADKDLIDTYSAKHDLMFEYVWNYKELQGAYQYSDGLIVNPKATIIIKDVRGSKH